MLSPSFKKFQAIFAILINLKIIEVKSCDTPSFFNTTVTVVGVRGIDVISGCLEPQGPLDKASYIQIINQTIPELREGAVQNLTNLVDLILDDNSIENIQPAAFFNLPKLKLLRLKNNKLKVLREGVLNHLRGVTEVNFMNNSIEVIEQHAFDNMTSLTVVNFELNKLSEWNQNWFFNCPNLNSLTFKRNLITSLPSRAFHNLNGFHQIQGKNISTNIFLSDNAISYVDPKSLEGLSIIGWLFLSQNEIETLHDEWLSEVQQLDWLKLGGNKLVCVPEEVIVKVPSVKRYLDGNPLSSECKERLAKA